MSPGKSHDFVIRRYFTAPRELVWKCWSEPEYLSEWWGPHGYSVQKIELDFRVKGKWLLCMSGRGRETWITGKYVEIEPLERIITTDSFADKKGKVVSPSVYGMDGWPDVTDLIVNFKQDRDGTLVTIKQTAPLNLVLNLGVDQGWSESLTRLGALLDRLQHE